MKYKPSRDIPEAIQELKSLSPSKIAEWVKAHRIEHKGALKAQAEVSVQSISNWIKRNPEVVAPLEKTAVQSEISATTISSALFQNGAFRETASVKSWVRDLTNNGAKDTVINGWVNGLKRVCQGNIRTGEDISGWGLKHPDSLTMEDAKNFLFEVKKKGYRSREWRLLLRNFLSSKGVVVRPTDISGKLEDDAGKFGDLYISREQIYEILAYLKALNNTAYLASKFAYTTASRLTATLEASWQYVNFEEHTIKVFEKAVKGKSKKQVIKVIRDDLWKELQEARGTDDKVFPIDAQEINSLLRAAFKEVIPELEKRIEMPFHFWRHMYAQHMLRASNWNYGLVAKLGNWSTQALEKYYGQPPAEVVKAFGLQTLPQL